MAPLALSAHFTARACSLGSATLYGASRLSCPVDPLVRNLRAGTSFAAPAYPLVCAPGDNRAIHQAMERVPRGSVLMISTRNAIAGYWDAALTAAAEEAGVVGVVIDGRLRDAGAATGRGLPVFARGVLSRSAETISTHALQAGPSSVGEPTLFTGVPVASGDLVVADDDGVIVIPAAEARRAIIAGEARVAGRPG